jgi:hypothetical protein
VIPELGPDPIDPTVAARLIFVNELEALQAKLYAVNDVFLEVLFG